MFGCPCHEVPDNNMSCRVRRRFRAHSQGRTCPGVSSLRQLGPDLIVKESRSDHVITEVQSQHHDLGGSLIHGDGALRRLVDPGLDATVGTCSPDGVIVVDGIGESGDESQDLND
jgi:hypothetical protein